MLQRNKLILMVVSLLCVLSIGIIVSAGYINTNRDTRPAPEPAESDLQVSWEYELLHTAGDFEYYFREDRDIIAVKNTKTGYVWKTGIDAPFAEQVEDAHELVYEEEFTDETQEEIDEEYVDLADEIWEDMEDKATDEEKIAHIKELADSHIEASMTDTFLAMANSLITIEYFSGEGDQMTTNRLSSASKDEKDGKSSFVKVGGSNEWRLEFYVKKLDLSMNVYVTFGDDGSIKYDIPYEEIAGEGKNLLAAVIISPYLGASGGGKIYFSEEAGYFDDEIVEPKEIIPGYAFVPDGSGSLIRFTSSMVEFTEYEGDVYGLDPSAHDKYYQAESNLVPLQTPTMPVFGISHGDGTQSAFVAYAEGGAEYMRINAFAASSAPNAIRYTYVYPKFEYNMDYYQVINQAGDTYRKVMDEQNKFNVSMTYKFLYGDGSDGTPKADYTGMALAYRQHLIDTGVLKVKEFTYDEIPIRLDFFMADAKKGIISSTQVNMTTTDDVDNILTDVKDRGIANINSGLIGWQRLGETLSKPGSAKYSGDIGSEGDFESLITKYKDLGIDISMQRNFVTINESMMMYYNNAAKHNNTQYLVYTRGGVLPENAPVKVFGYALPTRTAEWMLDLHEDIADFTDTMTITGVSNILVSTHSSDGSRTTVTDAIKLYQDTLSTINKAGTSVNMDNPNQYLWSYVDRYLESPVGTSQYIYETDTVPFLQMVINGTMEVYAPYSNFSFYSQSDMLRMIDYNISPSFILTEEPSHLLSSTVSSDLYSTEYDQYADLIQSIYATVNEPLSQVIGYEWTGRYVITDGIILNTYEKDGETKGIAINYTDSNYSFYGESVPAENAKVVSVDGFFEGGNE